MKQYPIGFSALVRGAFGGRQYQRQDIQVDADGTVRVWDSVADHYTRCHSLSESQCKRLRSAARKLASKAAA